MKPDPYLFAGLPAYLQTRIKTIQVKHTPKDIYNEVAKHVCKAHGIKKCLLLINTKEWAYAIPRQEVMYIMRKHYHLKLTVIAKLLKFKDHTNVINSIRRREKEMESDDEVKQRMYTIINNLSL